MATSEDTARFCTGSAIAALHNSGTIAPTPDGQHRQYSDVMPDNPTPTVADSKQVSSTGRPKPPNAGKGRKKGVPNKATASIKAAILEAFEQRGGVESLVGWANENPTEFYKLWGRLAPAEVTADVSGGLTIRVVRE